MAMVHDRSLDWDGLLNGRELGGIDTAHGPILPGRLVRSASVHTLSAAGWQELVDHGIRTVIDLRHDHEVEGAPVPDALRRAEVALLHQPLEPSGYVQDWAEREDRWSCPHVLAAHPSTGCFADPEEARHVRSKLARRLCRAG